MSDGVAVVLTYHSISAGPPPLCVSADELSRQIDAFIEAGYRPMALAELVDQRLGGRAPERCFAVTFDDAYRDFAEAALPVLERRAVPATLFATASSERSSLPGGLDRPLLALDQLRDLHRHGIEVGAHGRTHADLTGLDGDRLYDELVTARQELESLTGGQIASLAYPYGYCDRTVLAETRKHYRFAFTTRLAQLEPGDDPHVLPRLDAHYLRSARLRRLIENGRPHRYLRLRRALRLLRGSERRLP